MMKFIVRRLSSPDNELIMEVLNLEDLMDFIMNCDAKLRRMGKDANGVAIRSENGKWVMTIID